MLDLRVKSFSRAWALKWGALLLLCTFIGLLNSTIVWTSKLSEGDDISPAWPLAMEMTGSWTVFFLLPPVLWLARHFPFTKESWARRLLLHTAATIPFGVAHTLLMWGSRSLLFHLLGWGGYNYGLMRFRFLMEFQKQFLVYWGIVGSVAFLRYVRVNRERELRASRLEQQLTGAKLEALKMQLNPHFLFNTLNMISSHVHEDPGAADAMITRLSDFLRMTLRHSGRQEVALSEEIEFLDAYVAIMSARFQERLSVEMAIDGETRGALVPHLILQPLVENSVSHCTRRQGVGGRVSVATERANGRLRITVEDNGPGIEGDPGSAVGRGVGLTNTAARLEALYGTEQSVDLRNIPGGGLRLVLELPWRTAGSAEAAP
jgi:two-component sensor histidine kinase